MDGIEKSVMSLLSHPQNEVNRETDEDYMMDGLLYCGKCHEKKQHHIRVFGEEYVVPCLCRCRTEELRKQEEQRARQEKMMSIERMRNVSLMSNKFREATFENYEAREGNRKAYRISRNYVDRFSEMYKKSQGLLFYGPVGVGKSYTAACIANALLERGTPVVMTSFVKILQEIQNNTEKEQNYIAMFDNVKLLIIDDLGAERSTDYAQEKVYNIIDSRSRAYKPMILTTNLTFEYMKDPKDIRYARIYDRIFDTCYPIQITGRSFRLDSANKRFAEMKSLLRDVED